MQSMTQPETRLIAPSNQWPGPKHDLAASNTAEILMHSHTDRVWAFGDNRVIHEALDLDA